MTMTLEEEIALNQKTLMEASAAESVNDWQANLGNERLRRSRVLIKKIIGQGDEQSLDFVAEYYGVHLHKEKRKG